MSRGAGLCKRCGGVKRGRGARTASPITSCDECRDPVCLRHSVWSPERGAYVCTKCDRASKSAAGG